MDVFSVAFKDLVWSALERACKGGEGITAARLTENLGFSEDEIGVVKACVAREFIKHGMIEVEKGKNGGYFMTGVARIKSHAASYDLSPEYIASVRETTLRLLNMKPSGIKTAIIAGNVGDLNEGKVQAALVHLSDEFEISKGAGVRKRQDKNPAKNPPASPAPEPAATSASPEQVAAQ